MGLKLRTIGATLAISAGLSAQSPTPRLEHILRLTHIEVSPTVATGKAVVSMEWQNLAGKTITAFSASWTAHFANGEEKTGNDWKRDLLYTAVLPGSRAPLLGPGKNYADHGEVPVGREQTPPSSVAAYATAVVFDDGSALGDPWIVQSFAAERLAFSRDRADLIRQLRAARETAPSDVDLVTRLNRIAEDSPEHGQVIRMFAQIVPAGRPTFDHMLDVWEAQGRAVAQDKLVSSPVEQEVPLGLKVERKEPNYELSWNRDASIVKMAARARLLIADGKQTESVELDLGQLRAGSIVYAPVTHDVIFQLEVANEAQGRKVVESVRTGATTISPAASPAK